MSASANEPDTQAVPVDGAETPETASREDALAAGLAQLVQRGRSGADWFFWIAALSLVNTAIIHTGGDTHFIVGLGITQILDGIAGIIGKENPDAQSMAMCLAIGFSVLCSIATAIVGAFARNRWQVIFAIGMFLYLLDGLLFVLVQDWMSAGFHAFALYCMWGGFASFRQLGTIEKQLIATVPQPA